jgi:hypothetical protein
MLGLLAAFLHLAEELLPRFHSIIGENTSLFTAFIEIQDEESEARSLLVKMASAYPGVKVSLGLHAKQGTLEDAQIYI